jgi:hypothetical protein
MLSYNFNNPLHSSKKLKISYVLFATGSVIEGMKEFKDYMVHDSMKFSPRFIVPPHENFKGLSYGCWAAIWWNWLFSDQVQFSSVYFLRGNTDTESAIIRTGRKGPKIYSDTAIFFPIICTITTKMIFPHATTQMIRRSESAARQKKPLFLRAIINGYSIPNLKNYYAESPEFVLEVPKSSKLRQSFDPPVSIGKSPAVAAGYWLMVKPLPTGTYRIKFEGRHEDGFTSCGNYTVKIV